MVPLDPMNGHLNETRVLLCFSTVAQPVFIPPPSEPIQHVCCALPVVQEKEAHTLLPAPLFFTCCFSVRYDRLLSALVAQDAANSERPSIQSACGHSRLTRGQSAGTPCDRAAKQFFFTRNHQVSESRAMRDEGDYVGAPQSVRSGRSRSARRALYPTTRCCAGLW